MNILSGILLIFFIIDLALAAPVLVQEKRQAYGDAVHTPRDVISVLEKRVDKELEKLVEAYFNRIKTGENPVEPSDAHASSGSAPNLAPLTADPNPLVEPSTASSAQSASSEFESSYEHELETDSEPEFHTILDSSSGYDLKLGLTGAHDPQPNPNKRPLTDPGPDSDFDRDRWMNFPDSPPKRLALSQEFGQGNGYQVEHAQQSDPGPSTDLPFDRIYYPEPLSVVHPPFTSAGSPTEPAHGVVHPSLPSTGAGLPTEPDDEVAQGPPPNPELIDPELQAAAIYAANGKAKEPRCNSGITRDVGNAAQTELQPDERTLDLGEYVSVCSSANLPE